MTNLICFKHIYWWELRVYYGFHLNFKKLSMSLFSILIGHGIAACMDAEQTAFSMQRLGNTRYLPQIRRQFLDKKFKTQYDRKELFQILFYLKWDDLKSFKNKLSVLACLDGTVVSCLAPDFQDRYTCSKYLNRLTVCGGMWRPNKVTWHIPF